VNTPFFFPSTSTAANTLFLSEDNPPFPPSLCFGWVWAGPPQGRFYDFFSSPFFLFRPARAEQL